MSKILEILKKELIGKNLVVYAHTRRPDQNLVEHYYWRVHDNDIREIKRIVDIDFNQGEYDIHPYFIFKLDTPVYIQDNFSFEFNLTNDMDIVIESNFEIE